jgi:CBS-domain-containing membrane protein
MKARDVMVSPVITVKPSSSVKEAAKVFLERGISAAPVVDDEGKLVAIVSEGDLLHRAEAGTERHRSWLLQLFTAEETLATEYIKAHARKVADVMTRDVITRLGPSVMSACWLRRIQFSVDTRCASERLPAPSSGNRAE